MAVSRTYPTTLDEQICFALYATSNAVTRFYRPLLKKLGLTYPQYIAMMALWEQDGVTVTALGARLELDSGTLTPLLKRLEKAGLVDRRRDERDERQVIISLTKRGLALKQRAAGLPQELGCALGMAPDDMQTLVATLDILRRRLAESRV